MSVTVILILAGLAVALVFLAGFVWCVRSGQYEDLLTPSMRMLLDDPATPKIFPEIAKEAAPLPVSPTKTGAATTKNTE